MPVSLELTIPSTHRIGTEVGRALMPMGNEIITQLRRIDENIQYYTDLFRPLPDRLGTTVTDGIQRLSVRVYETNQTMLDHIEAMRWAIAYFAYNTMADVWLLLQAMYAREGQILEAIRAIRGDLAGIAFEITALGNCVCGLLQAILDQLRAGVNLVGRIDIVITSSGGGGGPFDFLKDINLWKLLAFLAILAGFVAVLGLAMSLFTKNALFAAFAIALFVKAMIPLLDKLASFDWPTIGKLVVGLAALAGFAYALGKALALLNAETLKALPPLTEFIDHLGDFAVKLGKLSVGDMGVLIGSLAALSGFLYALGKSLALVSAETLKTLPPLTQFIDHLGDFAVKLGKLSVGDMGVLIGSLAALSGFLYALGKSLALVSAETLKTLGPLSEFLDHLADFATRLAAFSLGKVAALGASLLFLGLFVSSLAGALSKLTAETLKALGPLSEFLDHLADFATKLAAFSFGQVVALGASLLFLALFVSSLASSVSGLSVELLTALPSFTALIGTLQSLAVALANMSGWQLLAMAGGFALIAGFVWALAAALKYAEGPLQSIASILENLRGILEDIAEYGDKLLGFLGGLGGGGGFGDFLQGLLGGLGGGILGGLGGGSLLNLIPEILPLFVSNAPPVGAPGAPAGGATMLAAAPPPAAGLVQPAAGPQAVDASVNVEGGISVAINAEKLEADAAELLSDQIIAQLQARLGALRSEQDFRLGARPAAAAA
jgi:hypothetical protein